MLQYLKSKKLIVVADWASDSLTNQEFKSAVEGFLKDARFTPNISFVASQPSTIHTGFLINQIALTEERYGNTQDTVIFQNTDPRIQTKKSVEKAKGAEFIIVLLTSGMYICGPNAGYDFSFIRNKIKAVYHYPGVDKGSQFRSRDLYSRLSANLMDKMEKTLSLVQKDMSIIPEISNHFIGHIDNYGNIKTTITQKEFEKNHALKDEVFIKINTTRKKVVYVSNLFGGIPGKLVIYPGSSGDKDNPFMEISIWRHFTEKNPTTGLHTFKFPKPGDEVVVSG